ncbi:MAG TPA: hypothetical protein GXX75_02030 [Clostridiales bacterium]|nr:hypothetical protein [Clostridiales bacterium]
MLTVYLCFLAGGAVLPLISFAFGFLGNGADADAGADFDVSADVSIDAGIDAGLDAGLDTGIDTDIDPVFQSDLDPGMAIGTDGDPGQGIGDMIAIGLLPTSSMALSALVVVFGAIGSILTYKGTGSIITFIAAIVFGYIAAVIVQSLIKTLKRIQVDNTGVDEKELLLYDGTVVDTILPGQLGTVSFVTLKNIRVSYPAKCADEELRLPAGRTVKVIEIKNGIFIVEPKNKYE